MLIAFHVGSGLQTFEAVSGRTGELLWTYVDDAADGQVDVMNLYTGQFVDDVDGVSTTSTVTAFQTSSTFTAEILSLNQVSSRHRFIDIMYGLNLFGL